MDFDFTEENRGPPARRLCVAMIVLPAIFIFLRFWSRAITHDGKYGIDDWLALMGLVSRVLFLYRCSSSTDGL